MHEKGEGGEHVASHYPNVNSLSRMNEGSPAAAVDFTLASLPNTLLFQAIVKVAYMDWFIFMTAKHHFVQGLLIF